MNRVSFLIATFVWILIKKQMKNFIQRYGLAVLGVLLGGLGGFAYYYFVGCSTGSCAITSKPVNSSVYGMVMGYLLLTTFQKTKKQ